MQLRIVLFEPEFDLNVGSAARAMKNFGCKELWLVNPKCKLGLEAKKFAKHSEEVLTEARKVKTLEEAVAGVDLVVGTSGVPDRFSSELKNVVPLRKAVEKAADAGTVAIVFGSESRGLHREELKHCDIVAYVPAFSEHTVLNLSHAVAVVTYEFFMASAGKPSAIPKRNMRPASREKRLHLEKMFEELVRSMSGIQDPRKVSNAFRNVIERARPSRDEVQALLAPIGPMRRIAKKTR
jgi:tRNA/rRNA methyltransferase